MKILEISEKFQGNVIKHNNECIHIHPTLGLKYTKILEISEKFQGNVIKHNNECIHIHRNRRPEIYENFGNFKEISEKFREISGKFHQTQ